MHIEKLQKGLESNPILNNYVRKIVTKIKRSGGNALIVGGFIRDQLLDMSCKDIDLEVYNIPLEKLKVLLQEEGKINEVGESFVVLKFKIPELCDSIDISLPRRDNKVKPGHKGFIVEGDPYMSIEEAARRRDLTVNSLAYDPIENMLYDYFGGLSDIDDKILRMTDQKTFIEDPLRVLRVMQFAGRLEFSPDLTLINICKLISDTLKELPKERIYTEFEKLLLKSKKPSFGLSLIPVLGINILFPELDILRNIHQDFIWHPEGSVWNHTLLVVDQAAKLRSMFDLKDKMIFMLAALLHDIGKPSTTETNEEGRIISYKHAKVGSDIARDIMNRLTNEVDIIEKVVSLVRDHLFPTNYYHCKVGDSVIRRLAKRVNIPMLVELSKADKLGRTYEHQDDLRAEKWLEEKYYELKLDQPDTLKPLVMGRHLLVLGYQPGVELGNILKKIYEAQIEGKFQTVEDGLKYAEEESIIRG